MSSPFESFLELTEGQFSLHERRQRIIDIGLALTGMETGIVTEKQSMELCFLRVRTNVGDDLEMDNIPIAPSVCGLVVNGREPLFIPDISETELASFDGATSLDLTAYAGIPLMLDGEVTGTLCFTDSRPRATTPLRLGPSERRLLTQLGGWLSHQHEVEARAETLRNERETALMLQTVFDGMELQASFMTPDGRIVRSNRATLEHQKLTHEQVEGIEVWKAPWVQPSKASYIESDVHRAAAGETVARHVKILLPDGSLTNADYSLKPICDESGEVRYLLGEARDVSLLIEEQQRQLDLERKLQEAQKLESLGVLAGGIAHDFNNLLTGILGNADYLRTIVPPESEVDGGLAAIEDAAQKSADLCHQMLAYSGRGRFVVEPLCLNTLVESSAELLSASISKSAQLDLDLTEGLPPLDGDQTQLSQVIMNVVINASEALAESSGAIQVRTRRVTASAEDIARLDFGDLAPGDYISLEIIDNGQGMEESTLSQIFDPFFTTKFTGRGLGLAAVLGIVRSHNAGLRVESSPSVGTHFELLFPISTGRLKPRWSTSSRPNSSPSERSGKAIVIDDVHHVRNVAARMLKRSGFEPILAEDGPLGIELFLEHRDEVTLILLDLTMPHIDGPQTLLELRRHGCTAPIVAMSGYSETEISDRFREETPDAFLQKPITLSSLEAAIDATVQTDEPEFEIPSSCASLAPEEPVEIRGALGGLVALIVDDQNLVRKACRQSCGLLGIETVEADDLASAREAFQDEMDRIDLALVDLRLTDGSGTDLVTHMRALRPDIAIVLMTGLDAAEAGQMFSSDPRVTSLQKPFGVRDLLSTLWPWFRDNTAATATDPTSISI